jgi:hypothetical protein
LQHHEYHMTELSQTNPVQKHGESVEAGEPRRLWLVAFAVSLAAGLAIVLPFFRLGNASGHDFEFHLTSWLEVARQWREGIWYPRWHEWANHGFGEPRFIFYPPLSWILGASLSFVAPWNAVPGVFVILTQSVAGLSAFALARRLVDWRSALLAAACYAANPYALLVIYARSDFAEQLASAILPLLFLFALEICGLLAAQRRKPATVAAFALVLAVIWLCNAPAGLLASYTMALLFGWIVLRARNWRVLGWGAAGIALGLALAAFYLVPAAYEQKWVNIGQALSSGLTPAENFLFVKTTDPEHDAFNRIASVIAVLMIILTSVGAAAAWRHNRDTGTDNRERRTWAPFATLAAAAALLMYRFTVPLWMLLPKLRFVQFPWRWSLVLAVPYAVWLGTAIAQRRRLVIGATVAGIAAISITTATYLVRHTWWDWDDVPTLRSWLDSGQGFEGTDEYDPAGDDHTDLPNSAPPVRPTGDAALSGNAIVEIKRWTAEERVLHVRSHGPVRLAIRLLDYPPWRVEVNGNRVAPDHPPGTEQMIVPINSGDSTVKITFERTKDRTLGAGLSCAAILCLGLLFFGERRTRATNV